MKRKLTPKSTSLRDRQIAKRILEVRHAKGVGQVALAEAVGVTFQQIQKYEKGVNRIAASRLWDLADALDEPIGSFFDAQ